MKTKTNTYLQSIAVLSAAIALVLEYGLGRDVVSQPFLYFIEIIAVLLLLAGKVWTWSTIELHEFTWRKPMLDIILLAALVISFFLAPLAMKNLEPGVVRWAAFQVYLLILVLIYIGRLSVLAAATGRAPTRVFLMSFALIILLGSMLLMLPAAHKQGQLSFTNAVFTATSATCVTGLIVRDTGGDFTQLGQTIILAMIQIGGLGIMIFGALFAILLGSRLSLRESIAMSDIMNEQNKGRIGRIAVFICIITFVMELLGTVASYGMWQLQPGRPGQLFQSIFHSVSAFCNSGFSLYPDSLSAYRYNFRMFAVICPLIIIGGLGFPVLHNIWEMACQKVKAVFCREKTFVSPARLSLHSKIVLSTSVFLLIFGWITFVILEHIRPVPPGAVIADTGPLDSLFNSITARTAGFNTVDIAGLSAGSKLVLIFLMSIGGSPSSTAGGIKTVTFAVMLLAVYATMRRRAQVQVFHRSIPMMIVRRASTLIVLYGLLLWFFTLLLTITEHSLGTDMLDLLFETASAMGTVGLSTGITETLPAAGKWVIIAAMFIGRLGPLSLLAALSFNTPPIRYEYPREPLVIG